MIRANKRPPGAPLPGGRSSPRRSPGRPRARRPAAGSALNRCEPLILVTCADGISAKIERAIDRGIGGRAPGPCDVHATTFPPPILHTTPDNA